MNKVIKSLREKEKKKRDQEALLIEQYKVMYQDDLRIVKEWETTDATLDWEWK